ncbi:MAG: SPOR domain-containing protein [Bacteroidaceae bacterium]
MSKSLLIFLFCFFSFLANAQERYTDYLHKSVTGWGAVVIHQDEELSLLVNGGSKRNTKQNQTDKIPQNTTNRTKDDIVPNEESQLIYTPKTKHKLNGYRIQLYAGGNSRSARQEATSIGKRCKSYFPELAIYTHFFPPRWICRVGDFKTYEEAHSYLRELQATKIFKEASIIKTQIILFY